MEEAVRIVELVKNLPEKCIEKHEGDVIQFHFPRERTHCPFCDSDMVEANGFKKMPLLGLDEAYVYKRRRYRCLRCKKTFYEETGIEEWQDRIKKPPIRRLREKNTSFSQREIARVIGIPFHIYQKLENKSTDTATINQMDIAAVIRLAKSLNVTVEELYNYILGKR